MALTSLIKTGIATAIPTGGCSTIMAFGGR